MRLVKPLGWVVAVGLCLVGWGCGVGYRTVEIVEDLPSAIDTTANCRVGEIEVLVSDDIPVGERPTSINMEAIRSELVQRLTVSNLFDRVGFKVPDPTYEIVGCFRKSTHAKVDRRDDHVRKGEVETTLDLSLVEISSGKVVFAVRFPGADLTGTRAVPGSAPVLYALKLVPEEPKGKPEAQQFVKVLRKQQRKLMTGRPPTG